MAADGGADCSDGVPQPAADHRLIDTGEGMLFDLRGQALMGQVVLRHNQQAAGILINAVDNTGTHHAADAGQAVPAMGQQGVDQGAVGIAGRRMNDHALGLVDHEQVAVLIDDVQRDILGPGLIGNGRRHLHEQDVASL